jgi:uncharacterized protein YceK
MKQILLILMAVALVGCATARREVVLTEDGHLPKYKPKKASITDKAIEIGGRAFWWWEWFRPPL